MQRLLLLTGSQLLLALLEWELVDRLAGTTLHEVAGQGFEDLVRLHPDICLTVLQDQQEHILEVVIRDQIGKHPDVGLRHQGQ